MAAPQYSNAINIVRNGFRANFPLSLTVREILSWGVLGYGVENNYPQIVQSAIRNCATASRADKIQASFIAGAGFAGGLGQTKVNEAGWTLDALRRYVASQMSMFNTVALDLRLNPYGEVLEVYPADIPAIRLGFGSISKEDLAKIRISYGSESLDGLVAFFDNWAGESVRAVAPISSGNFVWLPSISDANFGAHIEKFDYFEDYGQTIFYKPLDNGYYAHSPAHAVINDMMSWQDIAVFSQRELKNGLSAGHIIEVIGTSEDNKQKEDLLVRLSESQGSDNAGNIIVVTGGMRDGDGNLVSSMNINAIERNNAHELLRELSEGIDFRIANCYGVPPSLLSLKGNAVFSSDDRNADIIAYNYMTEGLRATMSDVLAPLLSGILGESFDFTILPKPTIQ